MAIWDHLSRGVWCVWQWALMSNRIFNWPDHDVNPLPMMSPGDHKETYRHPLQLSCWCFFSRLSQYKGISIHGSVFVSARVHIRRDSISLRMCVSGSSGVLWRFCGWNLNASQNCIVDFAINTKPVYCSQLYKAFEGCADCAVQRQRSET